MKKAADLVREFCEHNADKYYIYEKYSGKGMFGKQCTGIVVKHGNSFMSMIMELTQFLCDNDFDDMALEFEGVTCDDLGLDTIVYFPYMKGDDGWCM